jgi:tetratricopeptide (TPR) repeat protein
MSKKACWCVSLFVAFILSLPAQEASPAKPVYSEAFSQAYAASVEAYNRNDYPTALSRLDDADKAQPETDLALNLRGAVFVRMEKLDEAGATFQKLTEQDVTDSRAVFNLAEVHFLKKDFETAKKLFEKSLSLPKNREEALAKYKVYLCELMLNNEAEVEKTRSSLKPTLDNPFYYYANAALEFKKGNRDAGRDYIKSAFSIYSGKVNAAFTDSFLSLGWLAHNEISQTGATTEGSLVNFSQPAPDSSLQNSSSALMESLLPELDDSKEKKK